MNGLMVLIVGVAAFGGGATAGASSRANEIETSAGAAKIYAIEHATFVIEWAGKVIAVDPVGEAEAFVEHPSADLIVITDIHGDHLSLSTVAALSAGGPVIVAPSAVAERFPDTQRQRVWVLENGQRREWDGVGIEAIPMYNTSPGREEFHPKGRGNGYILTLGGARIYISGDTEDIPEMRALENIDAAFVCMNLPYTMDVATAASAVLDFRPDVVFPYHYRGKDGMSDVEQFRELVTASSEVDVRLLEWY